MRAVYTFEAKSIQTYILDSSRLKDMVGASEQIECLCAEDGLLTNLLNTLETQQPSFTIPTFSRRAGGAFTAFFQSKTDADAFQAVWTYCIQQALPGLAFEQGLVTVENDDDKAALENVRLQKEASRSQRYPQLPLPGPLVARYPRTGGAAVERDETNRENLDKRRRENLDKITTNKRYFEGRALIDKVNNFTTAKKPTWPQYLPGVDEDINQFDKHIFDLLPDNRYVGIIHADGNNMGRAIRNLSNAVPSENCRQTLFDFSNALKQTMLDAVHVATRDVLMKYAKHRFECLPARPLVVGGDDLSFIVRPDLAVAFTEKILETFEQRSEEHLKKLHQAYPKAIPARFTACAGIAFVKAGQPFYQAYHLAESLCGHAKTVAKRHSVNQLTPGALAFHRITTSVIDDYQTISERELDKGNIHLTISERELERDKSNIHLSMQPYFVGDVNADLNPQLTHLITLADALRSKNVSHGTLRELLNLLQHTTRQQAHAHFQRWRDNLSKSPHKALLGKILGTLRALT